MLTRSCHRMVCFMLSWHEFRFLASCMSMCLSPIAVHVTEGSLHDIGPQALRQAQCDWGPSLALMPRPRVVLLLGGQTSRRLWQRPSAPSADESRTHALVNSACSAVAAVGGSLMLSTSRRTHHASVLVAKCVLSEAAAAGLRVHEYHGGIPNPYLAYLASADYVLVTPDSINMVTEACAAAVPVYVPWTDECNGRFATFHARLLCEGRTRRWTGNLEPSTLWHCTSSDDTERAAARVAQLLQRHEDSA